MTQKNSGSDGGANFSEDLAAFLWKAETESGETKLSNNSVVENVNIWIVAQDSLLNMRHQEIVSGHFETVMDAKEEGKKGQGDK